MNNVIKLKGVAKSFKGQRVLSNINIEINKGQTVGFVGANGSGKSVLFKLIIGLVRPDQGEIFIRNKKLGVDFDFPMDTGALINKPGFISIYTGFKNLKFLAEINNKIDEQQIRAALKRVGLNPDDRTRVANYSMGMQKKLGIAQAIMEDQDIIILDEPFNDLDYSSYNEVKEIIKDLKKEGKTILLTSHIHGDIEEMCEEVYMIYDTKLEKLTHEAKEQFFTKQSRK